MVSININILTNVLLECFIFSNQHETSFGLCAYQLLVTIFPSIFLKKENTWINPSDWIENIWLQTFSTNSLLDLFLNFDWAIKTVHCARNCFINCLFVFRVMGMLGGEPLTCFLPGFSCWVILYETINNDVRLSCDTQRIECYPISRILHLKCGCL